MAVEVVMPRLGWTMEEGTLVEWCKQEGEQVQSGEVLFTVESDKALVEVEALDSGVLRLPPGAPPPGSKVPVGGLLAYLLQPGEAMPVQAAGAPADSPATAFPAPAAPPAQAAPEGGPAAARPKISPRARRAARELGVDWAGVEGSGRSGRIRERDVQAAARAPSEAVRATPLARRMAREAGVDLAAVGPAAAGRRIQREDVEAAIAASQAAPVQPAAGQVVPATPLRRLIAQRLAASAQTTASVTLFAEADATALVALREDLKAALGPRGLIVPTYNDLMVKLTAVALEAHPQLNAHWENDELRLLLDVDMAIAVDTEDGLLVPVLRQAQSKSIRQIAEEARSLVERGRKRQLPPDLLQGGSFTITNLGMYGIDAFTPLLNLPQCAVLGVGRIASRPAVHQGQVVPRPLMALSLTFDHRAVDGGPAARFLDAIRQYVEQPALWLAG